MSHSHNADTTSSGEEQRKATSKPTVHTQIGSRDGVIVECCPVDRDVPRERDMSHLTDEAAKDLHDQLDEYLERIGYDD